MKWAKGVSGNPGGRPKADNRVKEIAQIHTTTALKTLCDIARGKKYGASARVAAAIALLDRGWGRPAQSVDVTNSDGSLSQQWLAALKEIDEMPEEASAPH